MKITVEQHHIDKGAKDDVFGCPIAVAAASIVALPGVNRSYLWHHQFTNPLSMPAKYHLLPQSAKEFVRAFDAGIPVRPFSFEIDCTCKRMDE
jgi:hypothetical protein